MTDVPLDLTRFAPGRCPHGHILRYGGEDSAELIPRRYQRGFLPCVSAGGIEAGRPHGAGHLSIACEGCYQEGRESIWYEPDHVAPSSE